MKMQVLTAQEWAEKHVELRPDLPLPQIQPYQRQAVRALQADEIETVYLLCSAIGLRETKFALMLAKVRIKS